MRIVWHVNSRVHMWLRWLVVAYHCQLSPSDYHCACPLSLPIISMVSLGGGFNYLGGFALWNVVRYAPSLCLQSVVESLFQWPRQRPMCTGLSFMHQSGESRWGWPTPVKQGLGVTVCCSQPFQWLRVHFVSHPRQDELDFASSMGP